MRLYEGLEGIASEHLISFHMPGHKNRLPIPGVRGSLDITEIEGADDLSEPSGIILRTEKAMARYFGSLGTKLLINGGTVGILAMLFSSTEPRDRVLLFRNAHKSIYNAMVMQDLVPSYLAPTIDPFLGVATSVPLETFGQELSTEEYAAAVVTTPTYAGGITDLSTLDHGKTKLLIDAAHGAHLPLLGRAQVKGDLSVESLHKTLPAMTQTAVLNIRSQRVDEEKLDFYLSALQSSSPNYLLMASMDRALSVTESEGEGRMKVLLEAIEVFERALDSTPYRIHRFEGQDPTKLLLVGRHQALDGLVLQRRLRQEFQLAVEVAREDYLLLMTSIFNEPDDFKRLFHALSHIGEEGLKKEKTLQRLIEVPSIPRSVLTPREAHFAKKTSLPLTQTIGRVAGEFVIPYPPGIPLLAPGEVITEETVHSILRYKKAQLHLVGPRDRQVSSLGVIC